MDKRYPISGSIYFREASEEWVLELRGTVDGKNFVTRHTEPASTRPENVAGLPSLYGNADKPADAPTLPVSKGQCWACWGLEVFLVGAAILVPLIFQ